MDITWGDLQKLAEAIGELEFEIVDMKPEPNDDGTYQDSDLRYLAQTINDLRYKNVGLSILKDAILVVSRRLNQQATNLVLQRNKMLESDTRINNEGGAQALGSLVNLSRTRVLQIVAKNTK